MRFNGEAKKDVILRKNGYTVKGVYFYCEL